MENCVNSYYVHHNSHDQHLGGGVWLPSMHHRSHDQGEGTASRGRGSVSRGKGVYIQGKEVSIQGEGVSIQGERGMHPGGLYLEGRVTSGLTEIYLYGIGHRMCPMEMFTYGDGSCQ